MWNAKNNKILRYVSVLTASFVLAGSIAGCSKSSTTGGNADKDPVELKFMMAADSKPNQLDDVLNEFYKRTKNTLNVKINMEWSSQADQKEKIKLRLAAGEVIDGIFDAPFMNMRTLVAQGAYIPLDQYFNNDQYSGLKKQFATDYVEANKMLGHNYGVPFTNNFGSAVQDGLFIRKDLREKYGLPEIKSTDDLQKYYDKVLANDSGMIPMAVSSGRGFYHILDSDAENYQDQSNVFAAAASILFRVALSQDKKKVVGISFDGDPQEYYDSFPAPYNKPDYSKYLKMRDWKKYLEKDAINQKDPNALFYSGKAASIGGTADAFVTAEQRIEKSVPGAKLEFYASSPKTRKLEKGAVPTDFAAWNFLCIPVTSKKADYTMKFIDWIFQDQKNHDLFEYGIEGKNWVAVGNDQYKYPEGIDIAQNYNFPPYELTWNPNTTRFYSDTPADVKQYITYTMSKDTYYKNPLAGFVFNPENVKTEIAKVTPVTDNLKVLAFGIQDDPVAFIQQINKQARDMGLDKIRNELKVQLQKFLDEK